MLESKRQWDVIHNFIKEILGQKEKNDRSTDQGGYS